MDSVAFLLIPLLLIVVYMRNPFWGLLLLFGLVVFFREGWHPDLLNAWTLYSVEVFNIHLFEFIVYPFLLLLLIGFWKFQKKQIWLPPYSGLLFLFMSLMIFSAMLGLLRGATLKVALGYGEWRSLFLALWLPILVPNILDTPEKVGRFVDALYLLATVRLAFGFWDFWFGPGIIHPTLNSRIVFWDSGEHILFVVLILFTIAEFIMNRPLQISFWWKTAASVGMLAAILFSYRRSYWLFLALSYLTMVFFLPPRAKLRWLLYSGSVVLLLAGLIYGGSSINIGPAEKIASRLSSFTDKKTDTNLFHIYDIHDAFETIRDNAWLGVGFGNGFTRIRSRHDVGAETIEPNIVHNVYLHIWLKMGVISLMVFGLLWLTCVYDGGSLVGTIANQQIQSQAIAVLAVMIGLLPVFYWGTLLFGDTRCTMIIFLFVGMLPVLTGRSQAALGAK